MGCWASREQQSIVINKESDSFTFLALLRKYEFNETIFIKSTLMNYSFSRQEQIWVLQRRKTLFTLNSLQTLLKNTQPRSDEFKKLDILIFPSIDIDIQSEPFLLRPPQTTYPRRKLYSLENECKGIFKGLSVRIRTFVQAGDLFPKILKSEMLFDEGFKELNISNNGKFTFLASWQLSSLESFKQMQRFLQLYRHRWAKIIPEELRELYCICRGQSKDQKQQFEEEAKKFKWNKYPQIFSYKTSELFEDECKIFLKKKKKNIYKDFTTWQALNIPDHFKGFSGLNEGLDMVIVINPAGKVLKADRPFFVVDKQRSYSQSETGSLQSEDEVDEQLTKSQHNNQVRYERTFEKELKSEMKKYQLKNEEYNVHKIDTELTLNQHRNYIINTIQIQKGIDKQYYSDIKQFFCSLELSLFLNQKPMGERFSFELEKLIFYETSISLKEERKMIQGPKEFARTYLTPTMFPTSSHQKEGKIASIIQYLEDFVPSLWRRPRNTSLSHLRQYTIFKHYLMDELMSQLKEMDLGFVELYFQKSRKFEWIKTNSTFPMSSNWEVFKLNQLKSKILDEKTEVEKIWMPKSNSKSQTIKFYSEIVRIDNIPVGPSAYRYYPGIIKKCNQMNSSRSEIENYDMNLEPIMYQLVSEFYNTGLTTEVRLNSKYTPIPQCIQLFTPHLVQPIPFNQGQALCIFLIDWSSGKNIKHLQSLWGIIQTVLMDRKPNSSESIRLIILGSRSETPVQQIEERLKIITGLKDIEEIKQLKYLEVWLPEKNYYADCEEYIYEGLLTKFFGISTDAENILLYDMMGQLQFRGIFSQNENQQFYQLISSSICQDKVQIEHESPLKDYFLSQIPDLNMDNQQWRLIKSYFRKHKNQFDELFQKANIQAQEGSFFRVESTKFKLWEKKKHNFKDYHTKVQLSYNLDEETKSLFQEIIDAFGDLF